MEAPDPSFVRVITTLGHVDHGKTTLMDALLAANNIISHRMAGKLRFLDSREDEQERGITMESSAVTLKFQVAERGSDGERLMKAYFINMVDTPGHVDFSSEVSTASRLCDGALVLVDVVEGVCTQTIAVLSQAWQDRLRPILVINKFDRLITELKLSPIEAYNHLSRLVEQVNAIMGSFFAAERMEDDLRWREERERRLAERREAKGEEADSSLVEEEFLEKDDEDIYFAPERGNVIFASAIDGWGFRVSKFSQLYSTKLGFKEQTLRRVLWGDFFLDPKTKKVIGFKHLRGRSLKPLFVQFVLDNIWAIYEAVLLNPNPDKVAKIVASLDLKILPRDLKTKDSRNLVGLILSQWLSLSTCIIQSVIDVVPAPSVAQNTRVPKILYPELHRDEKVEAKNKLEEDLFSCNYSADAYVSAYVSKMFAVPAKDLPENKKKVMTADEMRARAKAAREARQADAPNSEPRGASSSDQNEATDPQEKEGEVLLGFARLYCGTLRPGMTVYAVLPKYDATLGPKHPTNRKYITTTVVKSLYTMMGRELIAVNSIRAGNTFAIRGLEGKVWRSATLCAPSEHGVSSETSDSPEYVINLGAVNRTAPPIVRVALEPERPADMQKLLDGLKLLGQSDPCVETFQQSTGEHVIVTAGELHLERCLKDLRERFAQIDIHVSKPIVPFRETAVRAPDMAPQKTAGAPRGTINGAISHDLVKFTIRATPLPPPILDFILQNQITIRNLVNDGGSKQYGEDDSDENVDQELAGHVHGDVDRTPTVSADKFWETLHEVCQSAGEEWKDLGERIWAFGPRRTGGCVLTDGRKGSHPYSIRNQAEGRKTASTEDELSKLLEDLENHIETGFQLATLQGPLCAEPVEGVMFCLEKLEISTEDISQEIGTTRSHERLTDSRHPTLEQNRMAQVTGSLISAVRDACRNGLLDWSPRLMLAMYSCDIQASTDVLGKVYAVVAKRRGRIVAEEMKEGTSFFTVSALLPVVESFDIWKRTSGAASPQLIFSGYELLDLDPFWVPTTEEELEDLGEKADRTNIAKAYMDGVRERKGMFVDRKIVEFAEKQRTLKR
ncbi:P-loop containing nucleoside triphosphate hydrolase protein [Pleurotus eryngii]|uniref:Ribosome assembly protein 1 n=1 Tax=Pleurotus eryngii TaxID=5323 RepID=A0A9P5ZJ57_PLEER|nr:P-loop containing nucleoside triphosphate hydrolase protein [Pleurotus eryngii]